MNAPVMNIEKHVEQYVKLRDKIKELDDAHKEKMAPYREALEQLNGILLNHLNQVKTESARTAAGTVYKTVKNSATLADKDAFWNYVRDNNAWELLDYSANKTAVGAFIDQHHQLPPGVNWSSTAVVGVRRA